MRTAHLFSSKPNDRYSLRKANPITTYTGAKDLLSIINWLEVEKNPRYKRTPKDTFCNIYAYDVAFLFGAYLPRVWWSGAAIKRIQSGEEIGVEYGRTVFEQNANALYDWFKTWGAKMGWKQVTDKTEAQTIANGGKLVIIVGANLNRSRSGHITVVAPEHNEHCALTAAGLGTDRRVINLLQSQAGAVNFRFRAVDWQRNHEPLMMWVWG